MSSIPTVWPHLPASDRMGQETRTPMMGLAFCGLEFGKPSNDSVCRGTPSRRNLLKAIAPLARNPCA